MRKVAQAAKTLQTQRFYDRMRQKLWKLPIDRDMKKKDLVVLSGISQSSVTKMGKNKNVNTDVLVRICHALNCDIGDIAEIVAQESEVN